MKLQYISSACVILEDDGVKILCDPWIVDGAYMGSWFHYPPIKVKPEDLNEVDFIYISHIHPDHFDPKSLERMDKNIPIIINNYSSKFLKGNIETLGFKVTEFNHNERVNLKKNLHMTILAADNCNPELCSKFFGCALIEKKFGATQIDSMCVLDNNKEVVVNVNDCPWELARHSAKKIKNEHDKIDLLLVGYSGAGAYPQSFIMNSEKKKIEAENKIKKFLTHGENYVNLFKPKYFLPFAGRYTLGGKFFELNKYRGNPELEESFDYFTTTQNIDQTLHKCIILNPNSTFNISSGKCSETYLPINKKEKENYIKKTLSTKKYDYEHESESTTDELIELLPKCYERFERMRNKIGFSSETTILIELDSDKFVAISGNGDNYKIISKDQLENVTKFFKLSMDKKLLKLLLKSPKYAHWNNAEIGSHIRYEKKPDNYERGLYYCMNFFHS